MTEARQQPPIYNLSELVAGITDENLHEEVVYVPLEISEADYNDRLRAIRSKPLREPLSNLFSADFVLLRSTRWTRAVRLAIDNCGVYIRFFQDGWFIASISFRFPGFNPNQKRFQFFAWNLDFDAEKRVGLFEIDYEELPE